MNKQAVYSFSYITAEASRATQVIYQLLLFFERKSLTSYYFFLKEIKKQSLVSIGK